MYRRKEGECIEQIYKRAERIFFYKLHWIFGYILYRHTIVADETNYIYMKYGLSARLTPEIFHLNVSHQNILTNVEGG